MSAIVSQSVIVLLMMTVVMVTGQSPFSPFGDQYGSTYFGGGLNNGGGLGLWHAPLPQQSPFGNTYGGWAGIGQTPYGINAGVNGYSVGISPYQGIAGDGLNNAQWAPHYSPVGDIVASSFEPLHSQWGVQPVALSELSKMHVNNQLAIEDSNYQDQ